MYDKKYAEKLELVRIIVNTYPKLSITFCVSPVRQAAIANINVVSPKDA